MRLLHRGLFTLSKNGSGCESVPEQVLEKRFAVCRTSAQPFNLGAGSARTAAARDWGGLDFEFVRAVEQ